MVQDINNLNDAALLMSISRVVAECLDSDDESTLPADLGKVFPENFSAKEKREALEKACIFSLAAMLPGNPPDGRPGYLASDIDPREVVLNEIDTMMEADFDEDEHNEAWENLKKSLEDIPDSEFMAGMDVNCPDDYILSLKRISCLDAIKSTDISPQALGI